ncbi:MAG: Kdo hydroxylase family protein, partial [Chlamydiales bacterium]|nr:Kdo hydroxylase family protein [Chlamydiales bacterium]
ELLKQFGGRGVSFPSAMNYSWAGRLWKKGRMALSSLGLKIPLKSPYDHFMLRFHHFLKENESFQNDCPKDHWDFPPNSCWAVFTDQVSHAALSGQYALEQTFLVPEKALLRPEISPAALLQGVSGKNLIDVEYV